MTLPFWLDLLDVQPVVVLVHRNPLEIAASLEARDELGKIYSLALWERYARTCLAAISRLPALVTTYDEILADPLAWCERAGVFLGNTGVGTRAVDAAEALGFVGTELRHAHVLACGRRRRPSGVERATGLVYLPRRAGRRP